MMMYTCTLYAPLQGNDFFWSKQRWLDWSARNPGRSPKSCSGARFPCLLQSHWNARQHQTRHRRELGLHAHTFVDWNADTWNTRNTATPDVGTDLDINLKIEKMHVLSTVYSIRTKAHFRYMCVWNLIRVAKLGWVSFPSSPGLGPGRSSNPGLLSLRYHLPYWSWRKQSPVCYVWCTLPNLNFNPNNNHNNKTTTKSFCHTRNVWWVWERCECLPRWYRHIPVPFPHISAPSSPPQLSTSWLTDKPLMLLHPKKSCVCIANTCMVMVHTNDSKWF